MPCLQVVMIRIREYDDHARKSAKLGTSSNFYAVYQRKFEPNRRVMALTFGTGKNRTLSWLLEDDTHSPPPKPLYLEHELKGCAPACCRPCCVGVWPEPCCFPEICPGKGCFPGCFPCCGCGPDGRCCYGGNMCKHTCPTGGLVPLEDEKGHRIEDIHSAKYEHFRRVMVAACPPDTHHALRMSPLRSLDALVARYMTHDAPAAARTRLVVCRKGSKAHSIDPKESCQLADQGDVGWNEPSQVGWPRKSKQVREATRPLACPMMKKGKRKGEKSEEEMAFPIKLIAELHSRTLYFENV